MCGFCEREVGMIQFRIAIEIVKLTTSRSPSLTCISEFHTMFVDTPTDTDFAVALCWPIESLNVTVGHVCI